MKAFLALFLTLSIALGANVTTVTFTQKSGAPDVDLGSFVLWLVAAGCVALLLPSELSLLKALLLIVLCISLIADAKGLAYYGISVSTISSVLSIIVCSVGMFLGTSRPALGTRLRGFR